MATTLRPVLRPGSRVAAAAALLVAAGHLPMALGELREAPVLAALSLLLCLVCGHCAHSLWRRPTGRAWQVAVAMAAGMLVLPALLAPAQLLPAHAAAGSSAARSAADGAELLSATRAGAGRADTAGGTAGMADMAGPAARVGMAGMVGRTAGVDARGQDVAGTAAAALEGPVEAGALWLLLLLGGSALVRCRVRPGRGLPTLPSGPAA